MRMVASLVYQLFEGGNALFHFSAVAKLDPEFEERPRRA
jgi:hypothetical protein